MKSIVVRKDSEPAEAATSWWDKPVPDSWLLLLVLPGGLLMVYAISEFIRIG